MTDMKIIDFTHSHCLFSNCTYFKTLEILDVRNQWLDIKNVSLMNQSVDCWAIVRMTADI